MWKANTVVENWVLQRVEWRVFSLVGLKGIHEAVWRADSKVAKWELQVAAQ